LEVLNKTERQEIGFDRAESTLEKKKKNFAKFNGMFAKKVFNLIDVED